MPLSPAYRTIWYLQWQFFTTLLLSFLKILFFKILEELHFMGSESVNHRLKVGTMMDLTSIIVSFRIKTVGVNIVNFYFSFRFFITSIAFIIQILKLSHNLWMRRILNFFISFITIICFKYFLICWIRWSCDVL